MDNELIKHFEREYEYARASGIDQETLKKCLTFLQFIHNAFSSFPEATDKNLSYLAETYKRFISSKVLFPLTLKEGEFLYTEPGLSTNRRNEAIKWNNEGIYYEDAYKATVNFAYDSFTGKRTFMTENLIHFNGDETKIYIRVGKYITNHYFNNCYLFPETIASHKYTPGSPIVLNMYAMTYKDKYILFVSSNDKKFLTLKNLYDVKIYTDDNPDLKYFNITDKITKDAIYKKERLALQF